MKLSWIIVIPGFLLCTLVQAQKKFEAGLWLAPVTSQVSGDGLGGWDKFGVSGGAWVRTRLNERWNITGGLQYTPKGSRTEQDTITFQTFGYYLNYIEMPITAGYTLKQWEFQLGATAGVLLNQEIRTNSVNVDVNPPFRSYEIGGVAGVMYSISEKLGVGVRFSSSILPVRPAPNFTNRFSYYERGNYNQVVHFLLQYRF
ncbi:MAG: porin family protein [Flavobacteriales bacterium]|jgi:hypothetical protein